MHPIEASAAPIASHASAAFPAGESTQQLWSPCGFAPRIVGEADLDALFAAAHWSAPARFDQPWTYFSARQGAPAEFMRLLSCLAPAHQSWARTAQVLLLSVIDQRFTKTEEARLATLRDLGEASAHLAVAAAARTLCVHQIFGLVPERARELFRIPAHTAPWAAFAIGYDDRSGGLTEPLKAHDETLSAQRPSGSQAIIGSRHMAPPARV